MMEAWITMVFFCLLILIAFIADKINQFIEDITKSQDDIDEESKQEEIKIKKGDLKNIAKAYGENVVIEIA